MSLQACAELVERADPDRFRAAMAAPPAARKVLFPLYAFNVEVSRAPWVTQETMIAEMRLQWWRDALAEMADGKTLRAHEVVEPLAAVETLDIGALDGMVEARRWDIYREPFEGAEAFEKYLDGTGAALMWVAAQALGARDASEPVVRDFGRAAGLAAFLLAVPELTRRHRQPLLSDDAVWIRSIAEAGLARLDSGRAALEGILPAARPALYPGWLAGPVLRSAARSPGAVATGGLRPSEFIGKFRLLLTVMRGHP